MLRMVLIGIGLLAVACATLVACVWLASTFGHIAVLALCVASGMAAWVASELDRSIAAAAKRAVRHCDLSLKDIQERTGLDPALASRQLSAERPFNYAAWAGCGADWEAAFADFRLAGRGYSIFRDGVVAQALSRLTRLLDREVAA